MYLMYVCSIMPIGGDASKHLIHMYMTWVNACLMILVLVEYGFFCLIPNTFPTNLCHSFEFLCSDLGFSCGTFPFAVQAYVQHKVSPIKVVSHIPRWVILWSFILGISLPIELFPLVIQAAYLWKCFPFSLDHFNISFTPASIPFDDCH